MIMTKKRKNPTTKKAKTLAVAEANKTSGDKFLSEKPEKNVGGRPRKELDEDSVRNLARLLPTEEEAAAFFDISTNTFRARLNDNPVNDEGDPDENGVGYLRRVFEAGKGEARLSLRRYQWKAAQRGNPQMLVFLGKNMLGQRDKIEQQHVGKDGDPLIRLLQEIDGATKGVDDGD